MVLKSYLWSLGLRQGVAIIGVLCLLYYGSVGIFVSYRVFGEGLNAFFAAGNMLNYAQIIACALLVIAAILLIYAAMGDYPRLALMFLTLSGVYTVWCFYMLYYVGSYIYKSGWKWEAGYHVIFEFLFMFHNWLTVLSYVMDEEYMD